MYSIRYVLLRVYFLAIRICTFLYLFLFRCGQVGTTSKSNKEIKEFNASYLAKYLTYRLVGANCQDYVYQLVKWMVGSVATLPSREAAVITYQETSMMLM